MTPLGRRGMPRRGGRTAAKQGRSRIADWINPKLKPPWPRGHTTARHAAAVQIAPRISLPYAFSVSNPRIDRSSRSAEYGFSKNDVTPSPVSVAWFSL